MTFKDPEKAREYHRNYAADRRRRRLASGKCGACEEPSVPGRTLCAKHGAAQKALRERSVAAGRCARCRRQAVPAKTLCQPHLDELRARIREESAARACRLCPASVELGKLYCEPCRRAERRRKRRALDEAELQRKIESSECRRCRDQAIPGTRSCERHTRAKNISNAKARGARIAAGLCSKCGKNAPSKRPGICDGCKEESKRRAYARRLGGKCLRCKGDAAPTRDLCVECRDKQRAEHRTTYRLRRELGACVLCGKKPPIDKCTACLGCWFRRTARNTAGGYGATDMIRAIWEAQGGRCALTGEILVPGANASLDHILPRSQGGSNDAPNLRWVTVSANRAKSALSDEALAVMCERILAQRPGLLHPAPEQPDVPQGR